MKRAILSLLLAVLLAFSLSILCFATENQESTNTGEEILENDTELSRYLRETIVPIIIGVVTSASALLATLKSILKALSGLKDTKEQLDSEARERRLDSERTKELIESGARELARQVESIPSSEESIRELKEEIERLVYDVGVLSSIISIGLSASAEAVRTGRSKEMLDKLGLIKIKEQADYEKA